MRGHPSIVAAGVLAIVGVALLVSVCRWWRKRAARRAADQMLAAERWEARVRAAEHRLAAGPWRTRAEGLGRYDLVALRTALARRVHSRSGTEAKVNAKLVFERTEYMSKKAKNQSLGDACARLRDAGFFVKYELVGDGEAVVWLADGVVEADEVGDLYKWLGELLRKRPSG